MYYVGQWVVLSYRDIGLLPYDGWNLTAAGVARSDGFVAGASTEYSLLSLRVLAISLSFFFFAVLKRQLRLENGCLIVFPPSHCVFPSWIRLGV